MNGIIVREEEAFEKALRRFSKTCERAGILSDLKKYRHYEKPSEEKKRRLNSSKRKHIRDEKRMTWRSSSGSGSGGSGGGIGGKM